MTPRLEAVETMSTTEDEAAVTRWSCEMVRLVNCCRIPSQSGWVFSAFSFNLFSPIHWSRRPIHSASRAAAYWNANAHCVSSATSEWPVSRNDAMMSNTSAVYNKNNRGQWQILAKYRTTGVELRTGTHKKTDTLGSVRQIGSYPSQDGTTKAERRTHTAT